MSFDVVILIALDAFFWGSLVVALLTRRVVSQPVPKASSPPAALPSVPAPSNASDSISDSTTWLRWEMPTERAGPLNIVIVQAHTPTISDNDVHVVDAVLRSLTAEQVDAESTLADAQLPPPPPQPYDLIVFPEGLFPISELGGLARYVSSSNYAFGLVHIGLRGSASATFLVSSAEAKAAIAALRETRDDLSAADLQAFTDWLDRRGDGRWSLGALIGRDRKGMVRICIHAKINPSKYEYKAKYEEDCTPSDVSWVVSIVPDSDEVPPINIQPLVCSDLLTEKPLALAKYAKDRDKNVFNSIGCVIDVVSVVSCSPTATTRWRDDFANNLLQMAKRLPTHRHAATFLANFEQFPGDHGGSRLAGMSGVFLPLPRRIAERHDRIQRSAHVRIPAPMRAHVKGLDVDADYHWRALDQLEQELKSATLPKEAWPPWAWLTTGSLLMLKPLDESNPRRVQLLRFTVEVPPRVCSETEQWIHGVKVISLATRPGAKNDDR
jgi:hypothetical protein